MSFLTNMQADSVAIISDWDETLTVKRATVSYGATGQGTPTYNTASTITGHWQPMSGAAMRAEQGMKNKSDAMIVAAAGIGVQAGDQIMRSDNSFMYVNYVKKYQGHTSIFLTKTGGSL